MTRELDRADAGRLARRRGSQCDYIASRVVLIRTNVERRLIPELAMTCGGFRCRLAGIVDAQGTGNVDQRERQPRGIRVAARPPHDSFANVRVLKGTLFRVKRAAEQSSQTGSLPQSVRRDSSKRLRKARCRPALRTTARRGDRVREIEAAAAISAEFRRTASAVGLNEDVAATHAAMLRSP